MRDSLWISGLTLTALALFAMLAVPDLGLGLDTTVPASPARDPVTQTLAARLGTPGASGLLVSTVAARLFLGVPVGTPVERLGALAVAAGAVAVGLVVCLHRRLGLAWVPAVAGAGVLATGGTLLGMVTSGSPDAIVAPLVLGMLLCGVWWVQTGRPVAAATLAGLTAVTAGTYPVALAPALVIAGGQAVAARQARAGWGGPIATLGGAALGLAHRAGAVTRIVSGLAGSLGIDGETAPVSRLAALGLGLHAPGRPLETLGAVLPGVIAELGLLGSLLAGVGVVAWRRTRGAGLTVGASLALTLAWVAVMPSATPGIDMTVVMLLAWLPVGAGLQWALASSPTRPARLGVVGIALLLATSNLFRHEDAQPWYADPARTGHAEQLLTAVAGAAWTVAERPAVDRALAVRSDLRDRYLPDGGQFARRVHARGEEVFAFDQGRRRLEQLGLHLSSLPLAPVRVSLDRVLAMLPRRTVVAAASSPPPPMGAGSPFGAIGGTGPSPAGGGAYLVVGVVGGGGAALERSDAAGAALDLAVGDPLGTHPARSTVVVHLEAAASGVSVDVDGRRLAGIASGLALVALTPDGRVLAAVAVAPDADLRLPLPQAGPGVARVVGAEPCVTLPAGRWSDAAGVAVAGALAAALPGGGDAIDLYLGYRDGRGEAASAGGARDELSVALAAERFRPEVAADRFRLTAALDRDQATFGLQLLDSVVAERLRLAGRVGSVLLHGAPDRVFARFAPGRPGAPPVQLCGSVWGEARLTIGERLTSVAVDELDRIGWGWHAAERDGAGWFRWSDGPEAGAWLQLARVGAMRVEVDAAAAAVGLIAEPVVGTLVVNGVGLPSRAMTRDTRTYTWPVPAAAWKTGMNRVALRVSAAVSPAALGISDDGRALGLAIRRLELTLLE